MDKFINRNMNDLRQMQRVIDRVYQQHIDTMEKGFAYLSPAFISMGAAKANVVVDIMEELEIHTSSYCCRLRKEIEEKKERGKTEWTELK